MGQYSKVEIDGRLMIVTINRPEVYNACHPMANQELVDAFDEFQTNPELWVAIITGAGDKAFCTGADLKERSTRTTEEMVFDRHYLTGKSNSVLSTVSKPVIAAIKGYCMAGGYEMVLQCDIAIASDNAIFSLPEVSHGFFPGGGACQRLPRLVGSQKAKELIFTGRRWDVKEALELGLVNKVVPHDKLMEEALALAKRIAANPSIGVLQSKAAINQSEEVGLTAGLRFDNHAWSVCMTSDEWKAKLEGFAKGERKPT
jgi:crotonobetainyl-CoA hydratase